MRIITKEEEKEHYDITVRGGLKGGAIGLGIALAAAAVANRTWPSFRRLTLPLKAFFVSSTATSCLIIAAESASRQYEKSKWSRPDEFEEIRTTHGINLNKSLSQQFVSWAKNHRYEIIGFSWVGAMGLSLGLAFRNPYLSFSQKLVQARVYSQGITLAVLLASAGLYSLDDGVTEEERQHGESEKIVDPRDPQHPITVNHHHKETYTGENYWETLVAKEEAREERKRREQRQKEQIEMK